MKFLEALETRKSKTIAGIVSGAVVLIAVVAIANLAPDNQTTPISANESATVEPAGTAVPEAEPGETPAATRRSVTTRNAPSTAETVAAGSPENELPVVEVTLAPVEVPDERVSEILEERDVQVAENPPAAQTTPPQTDGMPEGAQGIDSNGWYYRIENGQKYVWHPVLGWGEDNGSGEVTIMDVESDGHRFYTDPDGNVRLDRVVTPSGEVITYEEYEAWRNSR
ncbi:MAG: hypothetical protein FWG45_02355 [Oscillospiraceae bacterium]|nr:hypothetical protein [Oscillospiraceae bacterium]